MATSEAVVRHSLPRCRNVSALALGAAVAVNLFVTAGSTNIVRKVSNIGHHHGDAHQGICQFADSEPLMSCAKVSEGESKWSAKLHEAYKTLCADKHNWPYMEVFLDKRFQKNYLKVYGSDGWADAAWVNYVAVTKKSGLYGDLTERLVESVHRFSKHPIVVVNFGTEAPATLDPERFPNLVQLHARGFAQSDGISFNFNKLRAVLLAQVKVGASLDSDMVLLHPGGDQLLLRTGQEITEAYPFPMMPTHFLDRDSRDKKYGKGNYLEYTCKKCPTPTMRWGQAQPSWTYWSMPFMARWLAAKAAGRTEHGVPTNDIGEDEDLLNVALWAEGATKSWCAFQTGGVNFLWENLFAQPEQHAPGPYPYYEDPRYYPKGIPVAFWFGHAEKDPKKVDHSLEFLAAPARDNYKTNVPNAFFHDMKFYKTFDEIKAAYPDLRCTL